MKFATVNESMRDIEFARQCEHAAQLGYDGIELTPVTLRTWPWTDDPHRLPKARSAAVRKAAEDAGLEITGLHYVVLAPAGLSITSPDDAVRARTVDVMRGMVELCADLGGRYLVHGSAPQRRIESEDDTAGKQRGLECFAAVAADSEAAGVDYCIEPLSRNMPPFFENNYYVNTVAEAVEIIEAIGSPGIRTMIDCLAARNEHARGAELLTVPQLLDQWLPTGHIRHIHLNDRNFRVPGQGKDTFADVIASLVRNGYDRYATVEPFDYYPDGKSQAAWAMGFIRGVMEAIELKIGAEA